jgi:regulator of protease activity HflC (stomatin/prohibitin superfamily)
MTRHEKYKRLLITVNDVSELVWAGFSFGFYGYNPVRFFCFLRRKKMNITVVISAIAGVSWLAVVGMLVLVVLRASRQQPVKGLTTGLILSIVAALLLNTVSAGLVFIEPHERGVVTSAIAPKGYREQALQPGLRWIVPFAESVVYYSISKQTYTMSIAPAEGQVVGDDSISARTSDGQEVVIDASVIFSIDPSKVVDLHIAWQKRFMTDLVRPLSRGVIRDSVAKFQIDQVYSTKRDEMKEQMEEAMNIVMSDNGLLLSDFVLRNITFSPEYAASVEQKQIAEQLAQQAAFVVQQREQEAEQARKTAQGRADAAVIDSEGAAKSRVIAAEAEAEAVVIRATAEAEARLIQAEAEKAALQMIAAALATNPDLLSYEYIQRLAPGIQVMLVPNDNPYLLPLPSLEGTETTVIPSPVEVISPTNP